MSIVSVLKKVLKDGYYVVTFDAEEYVKTEEEALRLASARDKMGCDFAIYSYKNGVFHRCEVIDLMNLSLNNSNHYCLCTTFPGNRRRPAPQSHGVR